MLNPKLSVATAEHWAQQICKAMLAGRTYTAARLTKISEYTFRYTCVPFKHVFDFEVCDTLCTEAAIKGHPHWPINLLVNQYLANEPCWAGLPLATHDKIATTGGQVVP